MIKAQRPHVPTRLLDIVTRRSIDWWLFSEDLPDPANRATLRRDGAIRIAWTPNNVRAHQVLVREARKLIRRLGYPFIFTEPTGIEVNSIRPGRCAPARIRPPRCSIRIVAPMMSTTCTWSIRRSSRRCR